MKHFPEQDWIDFAREIDSDQRTAMQQHLDDGCPKCFKTLELWRDVVRVSNRENRCAPPEWAVRAVNASFALRKVVALPGARIELATLFFDSALEPVAAGVRGSSATARQLLYRSGSVCVDMRMEPTPGSDSVVLMGQLLDSARPDHGIRDILVSLLCEGDTVSRKRTNDVGEFDFGLAELKRLQLAFGLTESRTLVVPVPDWAESGSRM